MTFGQLVHQGAAKGETLTGQFERLFCRLNDAIYFCGSVNLVFNSPSMWHNIYVYTPYFVEAGFRRGLWLNSTLPVNVYRITLPAAAGGSLSLEVQD